MLVRGFSGGKAILGKERDGVYKCWHFFVMTPRFPRAYWPLPVVILLVAMAVPSMFADDSDRSENDYPRVFRNFMPEAGPSAFAVELSANVAFCYDPLRGGVNRLWKGRIDLAPTFQAKINHPAKIVGTVFYQETVRHPLRLTHPDSPAEHRFQGYRYDKDRVVFEFTLHGLPVTETLSLSEDGQGLVRGFSLPKGGGPAFFSLQAQPAAKVIVTGGSEIKPGQWKFPQGSRFSILITPKAPPIK